MKKYYLFIALAMVAVMTVSCKNNNKKASKTAEANAEVVEAAKTILADDVLAKIDELAQSFINKCGAIAPEEVITSALTEEEKLIKPDYLLEAPQTKDMVTKSQKLSALAILIVERPIRIAFGMPTEETDEVIARFTAELNIAVCSDELKKHTPSESIRRAYEVRKERGDIQDFWQMLWATQINISYLISKNTDAFFRNLNEDQFMSFNESFINVLNAVKILAEYDPEVEQAWDAVNAGGEIDITHNLSKETLEAAKIFFLEKADVFAARRANLLK